ncbi:SPOR domain-containing protein [Sinimarinibacterium sp. HSW-8]|uniref:SPOR domain-containing protein n=2 Tax=Sinimarinibacterium thermocellulolyticum TaxID=3170016 RepID=A0ABV2AAT4_9GAMM
MTIRSTGLIMLWLWGACAPLAAQATALGVAGASGETVAIRDGIHQPLRPAEAVEPGTRVVTGRHGRLELRLEPAGLLALGDASRVLVHSVEAVDPPARMHLLRLVVEAGAVLADSRPRTGSVPADLRINFAALRMRAFGAAVWMERTAAHDEVCLIGGAVELQTPAGPQRLDEAGSCLRVTATGLQHLDAAAAGPLASRIQRTSVPTPPAVTSTVTPTPPASERTPAAAQPAAEPATTSAQPAGSGHWTIVLASLPERVRAESEAARLRRLGLDTRVVEARRNDGAITWRVVSGRYATKAQAAADIAAIRNRRGLAGAWIARLP